MVAAGVASLRKHLGGEQVGPYDLEIMVVEALRAALHVAAATRRS